MEAYKDRFSVERCLHNLDFEVRQKGRIAGKDIEDVIFAVKSTGLFFQIYVRHKI